jgi:hypothetical protein
MPCSPCQLPCTCIYEVRSRKITGPNLDFCPYSTRLVATRAVPAGSLLRFPYVYALVAECVAGALRRIGSRVYFFCR